MFCLCKFIVFPTVEVAALPALPPSLLQEGWQIHFATWRPTASLLGQSEAVKNSLLLLHWSPAPQSSFLYQCLVIVSSGTAKANYTAPFSSTLSSFLSQTPFTLLTPGTHTNTHRLTHAYQSPLAPQNVMMESGNQEDLKLIVMRLLYRSLF